jgi:hypothetical protein
MSNQPNTLKMSELTNNNNGVSASVAVAEKSLKNARVLAETAFGLAKFNLDSVERELRTAEALALCDQTIANIKERIGIAKRELEASRDVLQSIRRAHINVKATMGYGDLQGLQDCLEADTHFGIFVDTENIETDYSAQ